METKDRFLALLGSASLNGIDFVELVEAQPLDLRMHFINANPVKGPPITAKIDGGDSVPTVEIKPIVDADWGSDAEGRPLLTLHAGQPHTCARERL